MTQVGEGRGAGYKAGAPTDGEILAERYQLTQHINTDRMGRQIWRGMDVVLRRPVAVVVRYPGGAASAQMLQAAVGASRIVHPNLVGVYDAIDEHTRAYVVREWVEGLSLRDHIAAGIFDPPHAIAVARACADAVTAVHTAGMSHGNIHPGTVLVDPDGRVVLADAHADGGSPSEEDIRAVGALLYFALTGYWPHAEVAGPASLPDALRDGDGVLAAPRQVRAGIPAHLDNLTMDLLDRQLPVPSAELVAAELTRLDTAPDAAYAPEPGRPALPGFYGAADYRYQYGDQPGAPGPAPHDLPPEPEPDVSTGPIRFRAPAEDGAARPSGRRLLLGLGGLAAAGVVALLVGLAWVTGSPSTDQDPAGGGDPTATAPPATGEPGDEAATPEPLTIGPDQIRVVDPPSGDRTELDGVEALVDGDLSTAWRTDTYNSPGFGNLKPGMGLLIDLGEAQTISEVTVELAAAGATAELRAGDSDPGNSSAGDEQVYQSFQPISDPQQGGTTMVFTPNDPDASHQYVMVWFTDLPSADGGYRVEVQQIVVEGY
ncbi:serine/threonine protein kinase [Natronosporangium hydrolyticum]|uniref:Serine/threonine protein kinase n=1 Tax=Natronosporangium hydrolyticum TaxID=2811111 RepID=A0A895YBK3_9ACTN|nr:protein kinase family protein [Natronosporangium hydrolyticum]QSB14811.1 serine/threonine protein kinase [Natronosporangium hydrolyticum]